MLDSLPANRHIVYRCTYHVVWCPKYRRPVLEGPVRTRLAIVLRRVAAEKRAEVRELEIMPDHVHLLAGVDPQYGIHRLVKALKGRSSHVLRREFRSLRSRLPTLWTNSYFVVTTGGATLAAVKRYIEQQRHA